MSLKDRLIRDILMDGPITVPDYVNRCLHDPIDGYYAAGPARRTVFGEGGDFVTAPLVSQMFGELIGLWAADLWSRMGAPDRLRLVEVGPGDGTLMADALRAGRSQPGFLDAVDLILIEPSPPLRDLQARNLAQAEAHPRWVRDLTAVDDDAPVILIANEVLDCMPARQIIRTETGWAERRVAVGDDGAGLRFALAPLSGPFTPPDFTVAIGQVVEVAEQQAAFGRGVGDLIRRAGGAALMIDYGRARPEAGDTLQALRRHARVDPLETPGQADLTQWADFPAVIEAAVRAGAETAGVVGQGDFLRRLGIEARADRLAQARPEGAEVVRRQLARLCDADQMGTLFKCAAVFWPPRLTMAGFEA